MEKAKIQTKKNMERNFDILQNEMFLQMQAQAWKY